MTMKIYILYDNQAREGFRSAWGFSCWVSAEKNILFDTGWDSSILSHNMKRLNLNPADIDILFISHQHWDHDGGISWVLEQCSPEVWVPKSFSEHLKGEIVGRATLHEVENSTAICRGIHTTGELGSSIREHSLILESPEGLVVITGCAHPGVDRILERTEKFGKIHALLGGFHGFDRFEILKDTPLLMPCHCTQQREKIAELFPSGYREIQAGDVIEV